MQNQEMKTIAFIGKMGRGVQYLEMSSVTHRKIDVKMTATFYTC